MGRPIPLIEFVVTHDYYPKQLCNGISMSFFEGEKMAKDNYLLFLKKKENGKYILYIDGGANLQERMQFLINDIATGYEKLSFLFMADFPDFFTVTDLFGIKSNNYLFLYSLTLSTVGGVDFVINRNNITISEGNTPFEKNILKKFPFSLLYVNIDTSKLEWNAMREKLNSQIPFSVSIHFEAQRIKWKYVLISRENKDPDVAIIDLKKTYNFSKVEWEYSEGRMTGTSISDEEIPFSEMYSFQFQLWKNYNNGRHLLINQLPYPDPRNTGNLHITKENKYAIIYQYF